MQGYIKDPKSGAYLLLPTPEQNEIQKLKNLVKAIYESLSETSKRKINDDLLEVIRK